MTTLLNHLSTDGFTLKLGSFGKFYVQPQAGDSPEDWGIRRNDSYVNEAQDQVHQSGGAAPTGAGWLIRRLLFRTYSNN